MDKLRELYYDPERGFLSLGKLVKKLKEEGVDVKQKDVKTFLQKQETYQLNKQNKLPSAYSTYWVQKNRDEYQIDLMVYDRFKTPHYKYILCLIDIHSRYAMAEALTNKTNATYKEVFEEMFDKMGVPKTISGDQEFAKMEAWFRSKGVRDFQWSAPNQIHKNPIVERFHKTLAGRLQKWRSAGKGRSQWQLVLPKIMTAYNTSFHRTIQARPIDVWEGRDYNRQFIREVNTSFNLGDHVRYRLDKKALEKGDVERYSEKVYMITDKVGKRFVLAPFRTREDGGIEVENPPLRRKYNDYELIQAREIERPEEEKKEGGERVRPQRQVRVDVDAENVREGPRRNRGQNRQDPDFVY